LRTRIIAALFITVTGYVFLACKQQATQNPELIIEQRLIAQVDSFSFLINKLQVSVKSSAVTGKQLQQLFLQSRLAYKKFEWAAEYFTPTVTRFVNGAPVPEVELGGQQVFAPEGLQVIEGLLFPKYNINSKKEILQQLQKLQYNCHNYKVYYSNTTIANWQVFDAARQEVFRVLTLGITGFDNPLTLNSMQESAVSLTSLRSVLANYTADNSSDELADNLNAAIKYLHGNKNFDSFNRAAFITDYGNRISISLAGLQKQLHIPVIKYNRLLNQDDATLFDKNAFNINAYGTDLDTISDKKITLGKKLFFDPLLSGNGMRSCASCHQPDKAFTDGLPKNTVINGKDLLNRNTPTLINAALQPAQFYDLRANTLEDQVIDVVQNKQEMHGSIGKTINRLWQDKTYRQLFFAAYPDKDKTGIDTTEFANAIASYIRSLSLLNSRFDLYMRGNKAAMNREEIDGFNMFMGKARCATCHYMPLFNGTLPPKYLTTESEVIGVPRSAAGKALDPDMGQYGIIPIESYKHAFKTPTIRNISKTAPYMHNGVFKTLKQVVDFYNKGGGKGLGLKIDNQTLASDQLHLTAKESNALIAFMKSLDSQ
jgi:cytochrome c peroxidase